jgi:molecular chaperone HscC
MVATPSARAGCSIYRVSGEDFAVVATNLHDMNDASALAQLTVQLLQRPVVVADAEISLSICVGIAVEPDDGATVQLLLERSALAASHATHADVWAAAQRCKHGLSTAHESLMLTQIDGSPVELLWTQGRFEGVCAPLLERLPRPVGIVLRDANLSASDLDSGILVGGASRMPIIRRLAAQMVGRLPFVNVNPDEAVALGAAVQVGLMDGAGARAEMMLTDVAPYSLGIGVCNPNATTGGDDLFSRIIERKTPVPPSRVERYSTVVDGQVQIEVEVFQGEARRVLDNFRAWRVEDLPLD